jgi:hypothetical protein
MAVVKLKPQSTRVVTPREQLVRVEPRRVSGTDLVEQFRAHGAGHEHPQALFDGLAAAGIDVGAIGTVEPQCVKQWRTLGPEAAHRARQSGQHPLGTGNPVGRAGAHEVLLRGEGEKSRRALLGNAIVCHA